MGHLIDPKRYKGYGGQEMSFEEAHRCCIDKTRFRSKKTVKSAAKRYGLRYYRCRFCGFWHLTKGKKGGLNYE